MSRSASRASRGLYWVDRSGWAQCPLVNPLCPDDLCILPEGHAGTAEGYHVLGTTNYTALPRSSRWTG